ncbi:MAG: Spx/MgsR family RNA polymerase-binding regulatory protein [Anaerovoracaceae bacterium]|jgi:arsenate reductase
MSWYTYVLRCKDGSLYTGITTDLIRRFNEHRWGGGKGAKYTASHHPMQYEAAWESPGRSQALILEGRIKALTKMEKEGLIRGVMPGKFDIDPFVYKNLWVTHKGGINMLFICYPQCTTCRRAKSYLEEKGILYDFRHIKTEKPTESELRLWHSKSGLPLKRFFNVSGKQYRELELSKRLDTLSEDEQYSLLATDGMLVKRPILVGADSVLVGFKESEWEEFLKKERGEIK